MRYSYGKLFELLIISYFDSYILMTITRDLYYPNPSHFVDEKMKKNECAHNTLKQKNY